MANDMYDLKKSWSVFTSARSRAHKMPVFETSDFSCPKNLTEFQVQVGLKIGYSREILWNPMKIPWVYGWFMAIFSFFHMKLPFWGINPPRGFGSRLSWKPRRLWSSGTGEGALGRGACTLLSWKPMDTMGFYRSKWSKRNDHLGLSQEK